MMTSQQLNIGVSIVPRFTPRCDISIYNKLDIIQIFTSDLVVLKTEFELMNFLR